MTRGADTDVFLQKLAEAVRAASCGTMLTRGIRDAFFENRAKVTGVTGVQLLASGSVAVNEACIESSPSVAITTAKNFLAHPTLATEAFGPFTLVVVGENNDELAACALALDGQLTATIHGNSSDLAFAPSLIASLERIAGRVVVNGFPTGVEVCAAMNHGGPYPATTDPRFTSVGTAAIFRFARPVCFQNYPEPMLPSALQNVNPLGLLRLINGMPTRDKIPG